jgi:carbonic anhydrase/acetyltransferase-like protein (isoleucine patch superfamily)
LIYDNGLAELKNSKLLSLILKPKIFRVILTFFEIIVMLIINLPIPIYHSLMKTIITYLPGLPSMSGCYLRALYYKPRLKRMGKNVFIEQGAILSHPKSIELDDFAYIDRYVTIASNNTKIGKRVHIAPYTIITGGGDFTIEDYACIANHSSIITSTETLKPGTRSSGPMIPSSQRDVIRGSVTIKKDVFVGTRATILTNVTLGEGCVIAAGAVITKDTEPWKIYASEGRKAKIIKNREILNLEDI